ncbi:hypothetical protein CQA66_08315 [Helicobacter aurati]|uniref:Single-stranded DNA-binding protein n=1 Tax=Helicobacter aurati TaxID=137778 RepID=A0A3D8IYQ4_9HELI|nr:single-stranded DNA-binding protein [Helicobacter aurati]RDU70402.1 hypothetical protein CQA66_08315 [Helicobacter aurati]
MNKVILSGRLTKDVNLRYINTGMSVCDSTIAVNEKIKKQDGEIKENTCFVDISIFGNSAEILSKYCGKGSKILIEGKLMQSSYVNQQGVNITKTYVLCEKFEFIDVKNSVAQNSNTQDYYEAQKQYQQNNTMNIQNQQDITNQVNINQQSQQHTINNNSTAKQVLQQIHQRGLNNKQQSTQTQQQYNNVNINQQEYEQEIPF